MDPSHALLHRYLTESSDRAFRDLVERHAGLVYQTALRRAGGDHALARDAAQVVFTDLAQKAASLPPDTALAGWLHRHTGFVTSKLIRSEQRRRQREHRAAMETSLSKPDDESLWRRMAPVLDEALGRLSAADRDALVLRYLEGRDFREVGGLTGLSENSARMRVSRALEKLRRVLQRQGITSTTLALGTALGQASQAHAPAGLPQALATTALQAPATATGLAATLATWPWWGKAAAVLGTCAAVVVPFRFLTASRPHETQTMVAQATPPLPLAERPVETPPLAEPLPAAPGPPLPAPPAFLPAPPAVVAGAVAVISPADLGEAVELTLGVVPAVIKFAPSSLEVKAGASVILLFRNDKCPHQHNFLLINPGTLNDIGALADRMLADPQGMAKSFLPESPEILARSTRLISIGQSELIEFTAPATPGDYPYVCTFPGHWRTMHGVLKVVP
jgi:RNA polymerase sigma factor (sigma-70 family)